VYKALVPIPARSVAYDGIKLDRETGTVAEVKQWGRTGGAVEIPGEKVVHWAWEDIGTGYGQGVGKCLVPLYEGKAEAMKMWLTGVKRLAQPLLYERVPAINVRMGNSSKEYSEIVAEGWLETLGGAVVIRPVDSQTAEMGLPSIEVIRANQFDTEFINYVDYINRSYFLAMGIPSLVMMESASTAQAQSTVHSDAARFMALPVAKEFVETCLIDQVVRPLIEVNFGEGQDLGTFPVALPPDEEYLGRILQALSNTGFLGMVVPKMVYDKIQALLPQVLPEVEDADYPAVGD